MSSTQSAYGAGYAAGQRGATAPTHPAPPPTPIRQATDAGFAKGRQSQTSGTKK